MGIICSCREIPENSEQNLTANKGSFQVEIDQGMQAKFKSLESSLKIHEDKIIKVQSTFRMHKVNSLLKQDVDSTKDKESSSKKSFTSEFRGQTKLMYYGKKKKSKREGFGIIKWLKGSKFSGTFINDKASGFGRLRQDNFFYAGEFKNDLAHGYGERVAADNIHYEGYWNEELLNGIAIEEFEENEYEGSYLEGHKHGLGKYVWKDGSKYQGDWIDNSMQGWGIYNFSNGGLYKGEFSKNMMSGYGEYILNNKTYIGMFQDDNRHGFGIDYIEDPIKIYVGFWKHGKKDGLGKMLSDDMLSFCMYENGKKIKVFQNYSEAVVLIPKDYLNYKKFFKLSIDKLVKIKERD